MANDVLRTKRIKDWATSITSFRSGDVIPIDGPSGTTKMSKDDLLRVTAQNALAGNVAPAFDATKPNDAGGYAYYKDDVVSYNGVTYKFKVNHPSGAWNIAQVDRYDLDDKLKRFSVVENDEYCFAVVDSSGVFLFGIRRDGSIEWQKGTPAPIHTQFNRIIKELANKVNTEEKKGLIDSIFSNSVSNEYSNEYILGLFASDNKLIFGFRNDGTIDSSPLRLFVQSVVGSTFRGSATKQYVDASVAQEKNRAVASETDLQRQINNIEPTIVEGGENNPDEFYLTSISDKITFKDISPTVLSYGVSWINPNRIQFETEKTIYVVSSYVDLDGGTFEIPSSSILVFIGGSLNNGTIVGNNTALKYAPKILGSSLMLGGTWIADYVCSDMLQDPFAVNALKKLNSLMSDSVFTEVVIKDGVYVFSPSQDGDFLLNMTSNTRLQIDGKIEVASNGFPHNYVVKIPTGKKKIDICGCGSIVGDADNHDYVTTTSTHEWCHGVWSVPGSTNIKVRDLLIKNCCGDAICLSGNNISIEGVTISHCGRQGISIEECNGVKISNCRISDIYRVSPRAAVDIEPYVEGSRAANIEIDFLEMDSCAGIQFVNSDFVSLRQLIARDCSQLLRGQNSKDVTISGILASMQGTTPVNYIDVKNTCERVFAEFLVISDETPNEFNAQNIRLGFGCYYNSAPFKPADTGIGSISYDSGRYVQYNGTSWVGISD